MGRAELINSGGAAGENDLQKSVRTAVINKRAGGMGLILGRKAFKKLMKEGVTLINAMQYVYLEKGNHRLIQASGLPHPSLIRGLPLKVGHQLSKVQFFMAKPKYSLETRQAIANHYFFGKDGAQRTTKRYSVEKNISSPLGQATSRPLSNSASTSCLSLRTALFSTSASPPATSCSVRFKRR